MATSRLRSNPVRAMVQRVDEIQVTLNTQRLAKVGADYMRSITPIDKGNARRNTKAVGSDIQADYPYAKRLDEGHSKQFLGELIEPTLQYLADYLKKHGGKQ